jgi:hypothetical protein
VKKKYAYAKIGGSVMLCEVEPRDPRDPDHTKTGIFVYNRCAYCDDGRLPCKQGAVNHCDNPRARND